MKVVFYSGCQVNSLVECSSGPILMPELAAQDVTYCCVRDVEPEVLESHVKEADLIIATPTRPDFEGDARLSSQHLANIKRPSATLVLAPNWDCPFYFPDDSHLYVGSELITEPCGGHFLGLFDSYMKREGFDYFLKHCVNNPDYIPNVDKYFRDSQDGNRRRTKRAHEYIEGQKNCCVIALDDFIEETHKDQLLSYTHNHPTAHLIRHFAESLCDVIGFDRKKINYDADPFYDANSTSGTGISPLYQSVQEYVNFDCSKYPVDLKHSRSEDKTFRGVCEWYLKAYDELRLRERYAKVYSGNK